MGKRKCKKCGRRFDSRGADDVYCSPLCRTTAYFLNGGGDTSKPGTSILKTKPVAGEMHVPARVKSGDERYERVRRMFTLPARERWAIAKDFTKEEQAYARRLAKRMMMEEDRLTREWNWSIETEDDVDFENGLLGESDDGSV